MRFKGALPDKKSLTYKKKKFKGRQIKKKLSFFSFNLIFNGKKLYYGLLTVTTRSFVPLRISKEFLGKIT